MFLCSNCGNMGGDCTCSYYNEYTGMIRYMFDHKPEEEYLPYRFNTEIDWQSIMERNKRNDE